MRTRFSHVLFRSRAYLMLEMISNNIHSLTDVIQFCDNIVWKLNSHSLSINVTVVL